MKTIINWIGNDWKRVKNHCRTTVNKDFSDTEPTSTFKRKLIIAEHTPLRLIEVDWSWKKIKSWVSVHWTRHKHEKFVSTQRDDRKEHDISRDDAPQGTLVNMDNYANAQQLIDIFRKRLCHQASEETREYAEDFKRTLLEIEPELSDALVPNCVYRFGCPEFSMCKDLTFYKFLDWYFENYNPCHDIDLFKKDMGSVENRYVIFNYWFYRDENEEVKEDAGSEENQEVL